MGLKKFVRKNWAPMLVGAIDGGFTLAMGIHGWREVALIGLTMVVFTIGMIDGATATRSVQ